VFFNKKKWIENWPLFAALFGNNARGNTHNFFFKCIRWFFSMEKIFFSCFFMHAMKVGVTWCKQQVNGKWRFLLPWLNSTKHSFLQQEFHFFLNFELSNYFQYFMLFQFFGCVENELIKPKFFGAFWYFFSLLKRSKELPARGCYSWPTWTVPAGLVHKTKSSCQCYIHETEVRPEKCLSLEVALLPSFLESSLHWFLSLLYSWWESFFVLFIMAWIL